MTAELTPTPTAERIAQIREDYEEDMGGVRCNDMAVEDIGDLLRALDAANAEVARLKAMAPTESMVRAAAEACADQTYRAVRAEVPASAFYGAIRAAFKMPEPTPGELREDGE
jgi:hypothetical protein